MANLPADWVHVRPSSGIVDQAELDSVLLNWNRTSLASTIANVPEPGAVALFALAALASGIVFSGERRRKLSA